MSFVFSKILHIYCLKIAFVLKNFPMMNINKNYTFDIKSINLNRKNCIAEI